MLSLQFEQSFHRRRLNSGDLLQWRCRNKDLVVVLWSSHEQEVTERERRFQLKQYWPRIIVICVILQARMISADFLQTCYQDMLAR